MSANLFSFLVPEGFITITQLPLIMSFLFQILPLHTDSKSWMRSQPFNIFDKYKIPLCIYRVSCAYGFNQYCPDQGVLNKWIFDGLQSGEINIYNSLDSELNLSVIIRFLLHLILVLIYVLMAFSIFVHLVQYHHAYL